MRRAAPLRAASAPALTHSRLPATVRAVLVFSLGLPRSFPLPFAFVNRLASSSSRSLAEPAAPSFLHARYSRSLVDAYRSVSVQCTGCAFPASRSPASPSLCRSAASSFRVSVAQRRCAAAAAVAAAAGSPGRHAPLRAERPALFLRHPRERARSARHCQGHHHRVVVDVVVVVVVVVLARVLVLVLVYAFVSAFRRRRTLSLVVVAVFVVFVLRRCRQDLAPFTCARPPISTPSNLVARCPYLGRVTRRSPPPLFEDTVVELGV